ncbi:class I SAM-dependent methyltransferase [Myroides odoratus]|uniref:3-demethylubiquinone-9 3-methyltransferase n=1 Tax=Myroides odoratus TaxID=256 RepID=A0A378U222_MYROD|nr:class I SAM-dependent methyltransferase [Myroides odoratus]MCS4240368.1 2-polyprenyl-3-methyl-5-hydroxy-6-metoxy-1,4-benzoquinol methylase [Myroides odoratus]QQU03404.1 class I SAM-dependent methyltransferase [Myroides odoratus]STZ69329.1 3-demethylubiquinone-9 3-methyltransferase [Myroides odoratus]
MNFTKDEKFLAVKDYTVSQEIFSLYYNRAYDLLLTDPIPPKEILGNYYQSENYISHTDGKRNLFERLYQGVKKIALRKKVDLLFKQNNTVGSLLDIGCGTGDFLVEAKKRGWTTTGFEPNDKASELATKKGITIAKQLSDLPDHSFDVITLWHVLEHIPNLEEQIIALRRLLKPEGKLILAVPNYKSYDAMHYKEYWAAFDVPRHIWHFSQKSIATIFAQFDFKVDELQPMLFDSFYVSLLSEEYKNGKKNWIKAFFVGLRSNVEARNSMEYSSLIYCLSKTA